MEETKVFQEQDMRKPYKEAHLQVFHYDDDAICCSGCKGDETCIGDTICPLLCETDG